MVKKIVKGKQIFARKAQPATEADRQVDRFDRYEIGRAHV